MINESQGSKQDSTDQVWAPKNTSKLPESTADNKSSWKPPSVKAGEESEVTRNWAPKPFSEVIEPKTSETWSPKVQPDDQRDDVQHRHYSESTTACENDNNSMPTDYEDRQPVQAADHESNKWVRLIGESSGNRSWEAQTGLLEGAEIEMLPSHDSIYPTEIRTDDNPTR